MYDAATGCEREGGVQRKTATTARDVSGQAKPPLLELDLEELRKKHAAATKA